MSRRQLIRNTAVVAALGILVTAFSAWLYAPYLKARMLLSTLDYHRGRNEDSLGPSMCGLTYWRFSMDTYDDDIDAWCVKSLYQVICRHLEKEFGESSLATYVYHDQEGWPRQVTVVRLREDLPGSRSYLAVTVAQNNDNDSIHFDHCEGGFSVEGTTQLKSWVLSPGIFRR
ncbi:hypothetical protein [Prosthecobacter vanneervenii]|uniref:Uncharacterized protein n=1 Tax=Prosthecobacter vanneervenii TaxID=48466 RepID=A0A7W8DI60_9BACT|nr:hypothetical protein [Prosthecobacter vanneervenii]MBB5030546.1 hypothetical protein [Prosthecobacter vanneervenii]